MSETPVCPKCGAHLAEDAPAGLCPKCLVQAGFESEAQAGPQYEPTAPSPAPSKFDPPSVEELARRFPQLEVLELLGKGGMGAVYKARQPGLDRLVALKILPPQLADDPPFAERFTREARAMAKLSHPNIVSVFDFGQVDGLYYLVMEFVDGVNLRETMRADKLRPQEALAVVPQICEALQFAHDEGVVHRDIKPENILLDQKGRVKIVDFGLAKLLGKAPADFTLTGTHQAMGTPHYMAPEQMERPLEVDHRADIYSLGVVFYEMLTGELPIGRFAPPSKKVQVDVRLDEVVLRALENEPQRRYQHASDIKTDVESVLYDNKGPDSEGHESQSETDNKTAHSLTWPAIGLVLAAILDLLALPLFLGELYDPGVIPRSRVQVDENVAKVAIAVGGAAVILSISALIVEAALRMMRLQSDRLVVGGTLLAMLVPPGCVLGIPLGIWALIVLSRAQTKKSFKETRWLTWRPKRAIGIVVWTIVVSLLALLLHIGLWPCDEYAPASYEVTDGGVLMPFSRFQDHNFVAVARGNGRTYGSQAPFESLARSSLELMLHSLEASSRLQVDLQTLGYRYRNSDGLEVNSDSGLTVRVLLEWMNSCGVESTPQVRAEAGNLLDMANGANRQRIRELCKPSFECQGGISRLGGYYRERDHGEYTVSIFESEYPARVITIDAWVAPVVWSFWVTVWLGGCALWVARAGRKTRN